MLYFKELHTENCKGYLTKCQTLNFGRDKHSVFAVLKKKYRPV